MTIYNLGSINLDLVYKLDHLPAPGETLASRSLEKGLGGKGANQSVAIAKAGGQIRHIGAVGSDGLWLRNHLQAFGVGTGDIAEVDAPTGHAVILVDEEAENSIILHQGANHALTMAMVEKALKDARSDDWLVCQNETNITAQAARYAKSKGLKIAYAAAPFDTGSVLEILDYCDLIAVNEIEARQLGKALSGRKDALASIDLLVTLGSKGAELRAKSGKVRVPAFKVKAVDTTGAGDTFLGFFLATLARGRSEKVALTIASAAAALQVTKPGASVAIPDRASVRDFIVENRPSG